MRNSLENMQQLNEGNISNDERQYRNFCGLVSTYRPNADLNTIKVKKTSKGNWLVLDKDDKKICLVSKVVLSDELVAAKNIKKVECE